MQEMVPSKRQEPIFQWRNVILQKNRILNHTAIKTSELARDIKLREMLGEDLWGRDVDWGFVTSVLCKGAPQEENSRWRDAVNLTTSNEFTY